MPYVFRLRLKLGLLGGETQGLVFQPLGGGYSVSPSLTASPIIESWPS